MMGPVLGSQLYVIKPLVVTCCQLHCLATCKHVTIVTLFNCSHFGVDL